MMKGEWIRTSTDRACVLFIHGIRSDGRSCWTHSNGTYWPELLSKEDSLSSFGIYVFTYRTGLFNNSYRLGDVVDALKEQMRLDGVLQSRFIYFVCHSMGGIVVRKYLVERAAELIDKQKQIGLFLIASPSLGSRYANWLSPLENLVGLSQANALRFIRHNEWLSDLDKEFKNLKESRLLLIRGKELVEERGHPIVGPVVESFSGAHYFGESYKVPGSDHTSIAKPEGPRAVQHLLLCDFLKVPLSGRPEGDKPQFIGELANRRSAHPADLNFAALADQSLYVEPLFGNESDDFARLKVDNLSSLLLNGSSILMLGEAGSGKSFSSYLIYRSLETNLQATCIVLDAAAMLRESTDLVTNAQEIVGKLLSSDPGSDSRAVYGAAPRRVFIIDGMDELAWNLKRLPVLAPLLRALSNVGTILVTCRSRDYNVVFAPFVDSSAFSQIVTLQNWDLDTDFSTFLSKVTKSPREPDSSLLHMVRGSTALRQLARRPLHARMLTFIDQRERGAISDVSHLYDIYLNTYGTVIDRQLIPGCFEQPSAYQLWRDVAWHIFTNSLFVTDRVQVDPIEHFLRVTHNLSAKCASRVMEALCDFTNTGYRVQLTFTHFSFYEFLVADHICGTLSAFHNNQELDLSGLLKHDLPREIRHHLVRLLNRIHPPRFARWLHRCYLESPVAHLTVTEVQVSRNLMAYLLGRLKGTSSEDIRALLSAEQDEFLRSSLYSTLCARGQATEGAEYIAVLDGDPKMRAFRRGYHLYYYSDIVSQDPPYIDDDPNSSWSNTREQLLRSMAADAYKTEASVARKMTDLYSFYDFCSFRSEGIESDDATVLATVLDDIRQAIPPGLAINRLSQMHNERVTFRRIHSSQNEKVR